MCCISSHAIPTVLVAHTTVFVTLRYYFHCCCHCSVYCFLFHWVLWQWRLVWPWWLGATAMRPGVAMQALLMSSASTNLLWSSGWGMGGTCNVCSEVALAVFLNPLLTSSWRSWVVRNFVQSVFVSQCWCVWVVHDLVPELNLQACFKLFLQFRDFNFATRANSNMFPDVNLCSAVV